MFKKKRATLLNAYLQTTGENFLDEVNFIKKHRRQKFWHNFRLGLYLILAVIFFLLINVLVFYPSAKKAYESALSGKSSLLQASTALQQGQFQLATDLSLQAKDNWHSALVRLNWFRYSPAGWLPGLRPKLNDLARLLQAGINLSSATSTLVEPGSNFFPLLFNQDTKFSELTSERKAELLADLYNSQEALIQADADLEQALQQIKNIRDYETLEKFGVNLLDLEKNISDTKNMIDRAIPISQTLPLLAGYPQAANYLLVLQNRDELRPTGGFIGTIGLAQVKNGEIQRLQTKDVYHLDMPSVGKLKVAAPPVLSQYLNVEAWYLRDANWSPDWPTSAKKILWFYQEENKLLPQPDPLTDFNFVVALTPDLIIDLMDITGPLTVNGQVYTKENFMDLLQDNTGKDFASLGYSRWDRKATVGLLAKELQIKLLDSLSQNWRELFDILISNLDRKNILLYSQDYGFNETMAKHNWDGRVLDSSGDYLMVVDANLAALKTDAVVNRSIDYQVEQTDQGLVGKLTLNYANHGQFSWKTTRYRSYTRVYVPLGSQLVKASGFMGDQVEVGEELGKTYFGAFISVEPGAMANLFLEYTLPNQTSELARLGHYNLLVQKQPGNNAKNLRVDLKFQKAIKLYSPAIFYSYLLGDQEVRWETDFNNDKRFEINL